MGRAHAIQYNNKNMKKYNTNINGDRWIEYGRLGFLRLEKDENIGIGKVIGVNTEHGYSEIRLSEEQAEALITMLTDPWPDKDSTDSA